MKTIEIFFRDLNPEAQAHILETFGTSEDDANWDIAPLAVIEREYEQENSEPILKIDRVSDWRVFSEHMEEYIRESTVEKYTINSSTFDLMSITDPMVCIWNVFKYTLRIMNGKGKEFDVEKISHYIQMYWTKLKN